VLPKKYKKVKRGQRKIWALSREVKEKRGQWGNWVPPKQNKNGGQKATRKVPKQRHGPPIEQVKGKALP